MASDDASNERRRAVELVIEVMSEFLVHGIDFVPFDHNKLQRSATVKKHVFPSGGAAVKKRSVANLNVYMKEHFGPRLEEQEWPATPGSIVKLTPCSRGFSVTKAWKDTLVERQVTLKDLLLRSPALLAEPPTSTVYWCWGPLQRLSRRITRFKMIPTCWDALRDLVAFDDMYFPEDRSFLMHYLKMHLLYHLARNSDQRQLYNRSIAWMGHLPEDGEVPEPRLILFNTGLISKSDRKVQVLLMCVPNTSDDQEQTPWAAVRVVLSEQLGIPHQMLDHVCQNIDGPLTSRQAILVSDGEIQVPEVLQLTDHRDMVFDRAAYPSRVNFGNSVSHLKAAVRVGRIPEEYGRMTDDELRSRMEWALERARDYPNIALYQWFHDKNAETGEAQLILPLTLEPPPALRPHLGLVLQIVRHDDGAVSYNVLTALTLRMVFSNVRVLQPRGGHWLTSDLVGRTEPAGGAFVEPDLLDQMPELSAD
uniref:DUF3825 domain-containing protein n=1 Tax=Pyrodinium bahamense TaxID=73915 RepID=A0A7S0AJU3_9DINO|mmetsp:Transcript_35566/g.98456  ORF Transcript_35566/g.98456 Transcript_35566/m.98456 type:complete len:478 (+) Transcript_35566:46-1479(+)